MTPAARRRALRHLVEAHRCSERRACGLVGLARSVAQYRPRRREDAELRARLRELAGEHRRFGYLRLHALLRREGSMRPVPSCASGSRRPTPPGSVCWSGHEPRVDLLVDDQFAYVRPNCFYGRQKVRLTDLRAIRTEMGVAYRAAVRKELHWQDLRAAIAALAAIASLDQGLGVDERLRQLEERIAGIKPNGAAGRPEARP